jgi:hypothetical protein
MLYNTSRICFGFSLLQRSGPDSDVDLGGYGKSDHLETNYSRSATGIFTTAGFFSIGTGSYKSDRLSYVIN